MEDIPTSRVIVYSLKPDGSYAFKCTAPVWGVKEDADLRKELWVNAEHYDIHSVLQALEKAQELAKEIEEHAST